MLARITRAATRAAPSLCMPAPSWSIPVRYLGTSVLEARHRIFGDSLNRDPSPFKALANLQSSGGFKGPKARCHGSRIDALLRVQPTHVAPCRPLHAVHYEPEARR